MPARTISITAAVAIVVVASSVAAGMVYLTQQRTIDSLNLVLERQAEEAKMRADLTDELTRRVDELSAEASAAQAAQVPVAPHIQPEGEPVAAPKTARQFAFVTKAEENGGAIELTLDYAQFLTGEAAAKAASEAGDESPPPNDFFIVNTNAKLRVLAVAPAAKFRIAQTGPDDTTVLSAGRFVDAIANNTDGAADAPYWFTIESGVITGGEEQWTP